MYNVFGLVKQTHWGEEPIVMNGKIDYGYYEPAVKPLGFDYDMYLNNVIDIITSDIYDLWDNTDLFNNLTQYALINPGKIKCRE